MRLTLRTLLAYRDGVLSVADSEDLHRRIQSSHDAGNLLKRIGAVTRLNQVLAPSVLGKGLGGDPNSIAEYLDDSLQHSQVPEFERICLVSDVQLAELADCHTLLSTAMSTKVTVPADLRRMALAVVDSQQRQQVTAELEARKAPRRKRRDSGTILRGDGARVDAAQGTTSAALAANHVPVVVAAPMLASGGESIKQQGLNLETTALAHEVPEYLVGSSSANWKIPLAIGALAALLGVLVWQALGPWDKITELFASVPTLAGGKARSTNSIDYDLITESEQIPPGIPSSDGKGAKRTPELNTPEIETAAGAPPGIAETDDVDADSVAPPGLVMSIDSQAPPGAASTNVPEPAPAAPTPNISSESPPGLPPSPPRETPPSPPSPSSAAMSKSLGDALWLPQDEQAAESVILVRDKQLLLRVKAGEPLSVPLQLIVPPSTRTTIDLPGGALWTACGPSLLELRRNAPSDTAIASADLPPIVATSLCRGLLRSGPDGRDVVVATPVGDYRIELTDSSSLVSVEMAYRPSAVGSIIDPQATKPVLIIISAEGSVTVTPLNPAGPAQHLKLGDGFGVVADGKPQKFRLQNIPNWFRASVERPIDALAAQDLHRLLSLEVDPSVGLRPTLLELNQSRRPETAALATQLSLLSGQWQPVVDGFFDNERLRSHWLPTLNLARQLLARDPPAAEDLRTQLIDQHASDGELLYDLICGPPGDKLASDGLAKLVGHLESPRLDVRVLATYQLQLLTGKNLGFQPSAPNRASVQQWRRDLATNRVTLLEPADLIWESTPR